MKDESRNGAIARFFKTERTRMVAYVRRLIDDAADRDGEDIVQDVMANLFNMADVTMPLDNLAAYVYRSIRNMVMPDLFGLKEITYWQAFALLILAKIFFGSFGRHSKGDHGSCGHGPWPGRRNGSMSRREKKQFERYWREEGKAAFGEYLKKVDAEKADKE